MDRRKTSELGIQLHCTTNAVHRIHSDSVDLRVYIYFKDNRTNTLATRFRYGSDRSQVYRGQYYSDFDNARPVLGAFP